MSSGAKKLAASTPQKSPSSQQSNTRRSVEEAALDKLKEYERKIMEIREQRKSLIAKAPPPLKSPRDSFKEELRKHPEIRDGLYYRLKNKKSHHAIPLLSKSTERIPDSASADDMLRRIEKGSARLSGHSTSRELKEDFSTHSAPKDLSELEKSESPPPRDSLFRSAKSDHQQHFESYRDFVAQQSSIELSLKDTAAPR